MKRLSLLFLALSLCVPVSVHANGIGHHLEIARRALHYHALDPASPHRDLLLQHTDAFQAGVIFPDWGFTGANPDASEAAHWTPFLEAASSYVRAQPKPWDVATQKLVVFLMGAMSHGVSDLYWHNLGCSSSIPGFLQAMSHQDFSDTYRLVGYDDKPDYPPHDPRTAHNVGDRGGMVVDIVQNDPRWDSNEFYLPTAALVQIYKGLERRTGKTYGVTEQQLEHAVKLQVAVVMTFRSAETSRFVRQILHDDVFFDMGRRSPFMIDQQERDFAGGTGTGALFNAHYWSRLAAWFESDPGGPFADDYLYCPSTSTSSGKGASREPVAAHASHASHAKDWWPAQVQPEVRKIQARLESQKRDRGMRFALQGASSDATRPWDTDPAHAYNYAGSALALGDFNNDGKVEVVVGVPGYSAPGKPQAGAVVVRSLVSHPLGLDTRVAPAKDLVGSAPGGRFGDALAVVDLNADGIDDLAVAAPTTGAFELQFRGAIHVYFGSGTGLPRQPDLVLSSGTDRDLLGTHLNSLDLDSDGHADLVVGSPYADGPNGHWRVGRVTAYLASQQVQRGTPPSPAWTLFGERVMDGFGTSTALIPGSPQRLVIGAPGVKWVIGAATAGAVYGYSLEDVRAPARVFSLLAQNRYGRFGAWLDVGDPGVGMVLAISAPSASSFDFRDTRHGEVFLVSVDELRGERLLDQIPIVTHFTGFAQLGRFGWRVHLRDLDGDGHDEALISEPKRPYGEVPGDKIPEVGVVYVWYGGDGFPRGRAEVGTAQWYSQPVRSRANRGTAMAFTSTPDGEQVYLASSRWSRYATLSGGVERIFPERPASAPAAARGEAPPSSSASNTGPPRRENPALPKR